MPTSTVKPIPDGMHTITPHLVCKGAVDAIAFYTKAFNAVEHMRLPGPGGTVMHAMLGIGDSTLMLAEEFENCGHSSPLTLKGSPVTLHLYVTDVDSAFAQAIDAGAKIIMPVTDMFWGDRYGQVEDPFGHRWSLATHTRDLSPEQIREAAAAAMPQQPARRCAGNHARNARQSADVSYGGF